MITGKTKIIAHIGYPTEPFKAPMIYNPWFDAKGIDVAVVPLGVTGEDYPEVLRPLFRVTNMHGALVTMPNKVTTVRLVDELTTTAKIAGSANAILKRPDGSLLGDMFDGEGFVRGVARKGRRIEGARALVVGSGGVGSAIAASLAAAGVSELGLFDMAPAMARALADRIATHYPAIKLGDGFGEPRRLRHRRQRNPCWNERRRPIADRCRGDISKRLCRRGRHEGRVHALTARGESQGMPGASWHGHAVRDDPRLHRILRLWRDDTGRVA